MITYTCDICGKDDLSYQDIGYNGGQTSTKYAAYLLDKKYIFSIFLSNIIGSKDVNHVCNGCVDELLKNMKPLYTETP